MTHELALDTEGLCVSRDFYLELQLTSLIPRCLAALSSHFAQFGVMTGLDLGSDACCKRRHLLRLRICGFGVDSGCIGAAAGPM